MKGFLFTTQLVLRRDRVDMKEKKEDYTFVSSGGREVHII